MKALAVPFTLFISILLAGCTIYVADPIDVPALAAYQKLKPGTPVIIALRVNSPQKFEQEGTLAWITKDTISLIVVRDGQPVRVNYAGRMIREIRVKKEPNQAPEPTRGAGP